MTQPVNPVRESVKAALDGARAMVEKAELKTQSDLTAHVNILSAVLVAVIKELGPKAAADERPLVEALIAKGRAAGLKVDARVEQLRDLLAVVDRELLLAADRADSRRVH